MMNKKKPKTVDEYILASPEIAHEKLRELRAILREVAPNATEAIKWGSPVLEQNRILFSFSAYKSHLNFMPTRSSIEPFVDELKAFKIGQDTIQFPYDKPLPKSLIKRIATYRLKEVTENGSLWMHNK
jgi:uncharacterized protein YdhG (YjbR/CyaY superfamily)